MSQSTLSIHNFSHIFDKRINSYKFTFFLAILELLKMEEFKNRTLQYEKLGSMMAAITWVPSCYFKLSLGARDQAKIILKNLSIESKGITLHKLYKHIHQDKSINKSDLLEYVIHRLIRPFFHEELRGMKDSCVNLTIERLSQESRSIDKTSIYEIHSNNKQIILNETWLAYLRNNYPIIKIWAENNWCQYLQKQNPNSPGVINKISLELDRASLSRQRDIWATVINQMSIRCIYTNEKIRKDFHLDHFLPWRFVAHNQMWNLVPTSPEVNISKSDSIPDRKFIAPMAQTQFQFLTFVKTYLPDDKWQKISNEYADGIGLENTEYSDQLTVSDAFEKTYLPLFQIAINTGFNPDWRHN